MPQKIPNQQNKCKTKPLLPIVGRKDSFSFSVNCEINLLTYSLSYADCLWLSYGQSYSMDQIYNCHTFSLPLKEINPIQ